MLAVVLLHAGLLLALLAHVAPVGVEVVAGQTAAGPRWDYPRVVLRLVLICDNSQAFASSSKPASGA